MNKKPATDPAEDWKPHSTPGFEINGLGQLRTHRHAPGTAAHAIARKPTEPVVSDGCAADWFGMM